MRSFNPTIGFAPLALTMLFPLFAGATGTAASAEPVYIDPAEIDRAVAGFTGAATGEIGGARVPTDRRLRLGACKSPLETSWHGGNRSTVRVECPDSGGWRIFVGIRPVPRAEANQQLIKRGDPITVLVRGRGFSVQQTGEALENGAQGDWIGVRMARKGAPVRARIERPGLAVIPASPR
ncbi:flagella basal body P-ring formation protein FlgA [Erythrobacter sp. THAF29]|uniref:flagella basal body P-ring formation protein FlgA n=1 Tax=Erythrobacter sp. THAF29 TaxID=2587851 RepID=UPI001562BF6B|nr:flagella basal body P-ring formation protein FlgA [Erythrobacter sp. THAF29]